MTTTVPVEIAARSEDATAARELTAQAVLEVDDLTVTFAAKGRDVEAVRGVSFALAPSRTLVLLGESGSGKSVTSRAVLRLFGPNARIGGAVRLQGRSLLELPEREMEHLRGATIGMVPQDPSASLDPLRRVGKQIAEVLRAHGIEQSRRDAWAHGEALLASVGIAEPHRVARSYPHELSGGMRQRAVIATAIACRPTVLIADEPTTALDVTVQAQVLELFQDLQARLGMALLMVTHDVGVAREVADRVAVMYAGRLVEEGPARSVLDQPAHPYTRGLLAAIPTPDTPRGSLAAIRGRPPAAGESTGDGCAFVPRCPDAVASCSAAVPPLSTVGVDHRSACPVAAGSGAR